MDRAHRQRELARQLTNACTGRRSAIARRTRSPLHDHVLHHPGIHLCRGRTDWRIVLYARSSKVPRTSWPGEDGTMWITGARAVVASHGRTFAMLVLEAHNGLLELGDATRKRHTEWPRARRGELPCDCALPLLEDRDPCDREGIWQLRSKGAYWRRSAVTMTAISALDSAACLHLGPAIHQASGFRSACATRPRLRHCSGCHPPLPTATSTSTTAPASVSPLRRMRLYPTRTPPADCLLVAGNEDGTLQRWQGDQDGPVLAA